MASPRSTENLVEQARQAAPQRGSQETPVYAHTPLDTPTVRQEFHGPTASQDPWAFPFVPISSSISYPVTAHEEGQGVDGHPQHRFRGQHDSWELGEPTRLPEVLGRQPAERQPERGPAHWMTLPCPHRFLRRLQEKYHSDLSESFPCAL